MGYDYLAAIEADRQALLDIAVGSDLELRVPGCPDWGLRDLLGHVSGASRWMAKCVAEGDAAQERILPPPPDGHEELLRWFDQSIDQLLEVLSGTPPEALVWTPIRGTLGSVWWRRKAALEVAIHRADAEQAVGGSPGRIDPPLALDGIDEYAEDFLPLMLHTVAEPPPVTAVLLSPSDIDDSRTLSLIPAGVDADPGEPQVEIVASAYQLLLWMWNRIPDGTLAVRGDDAVVTWWKGLAI